MNLICFNSSKWISILSPVFNKTPKVTKFKDISFKTFLAFQTIKLQLKNERPTLMSLAILFHFLCAQHVSVINISIIRSLRLCCWITTSVALLCFSLQNEHHSNPAAPNLQHITNWEQDDRCFGLSYRAIFRLSLKQCYIQLAMLCRVRDLVYICPQKTSSHLIPPRKDTPY